MQRAGHEPCRPAFQFPFMHLITSQLCYNKALKPRTNGVMEACRLHPGMEQKFPGAFALQPAFLNDMIRHMKWHEEEVAAVVKALTCF